MEDIWQEIDDRQPKLLVVKQNGVSIKAILEQQRSALRRVPVAAWFDEDGQVKEQAVSAQVDAIE